MIKEQIEKIVMNVGVGRLASQASFEEKILPEVVKEIAAVTGQRPVTIGARKSIAGFKIREGDIVGVKVTLRKKRMEDFFKKLTNIVLPRVKDFRGLEETNIDKAGNLNIGLRDQFVFPEIDQNESKVQFGMQITLVAKTKDRKKMIDFYRSNGVPLKR
ncbi:MAG: 50S ribosomal protein L5 [Nanoarchaeota archaeon]|nr:50S ribosomal protein L5 [Nanoarchaeota archaeon]